MIKEALVGNIVYSKSDAIVQGIAPDEDFSQGVALAVSQKHPGIVEDFEQYRSTATPAPGFTAFSLRCRRNARAPGRCRRARIR